MQQKQNKGRKKARSTQVEEDWKHFETLEIVLKKEIKNTKFEFYRRALSSKQSKNVW